MLSIRLIIKSIFLLSTVLTFLILLCTAATQPRGTNGFRVGALAGILTSGVAIFLHRAALTERDQKSNHGGSSVLPGTDSEEVFSTEEGNPD